MNVLIEALNKELEKYNLGCILKKETISLLHCYLYDLDDYKSSNNLVFAIKNYTDCKKLDIVYKKVDLHTMIEKKTLKSFCECERRNYDFAKRLNMLRQ